VRGYANYEYDRFLNDEKEEDLSFICQDILVKNCVVWNDWGKCLQIGTETFSKEIKNVRFEDCKLIHTTAVVLAIWLVDNAKIHDITFENTVVEYDDYFLKLAIQNKDEDIYSDEYQAENSGELVYFEVCKHFEYSLIKNEEELGNINGVKIENVHLYSVQKPHFAFFGDNENSLCENIELSNIYWNGEPITAEFFDRQMIQNKFTRNIILK
jgi:hypothetical protein